MIARDFVKSQIDTLPELVVERVLEFITFQRYSLDLYGDETEYLLSIPGMENKINEALSEQLSESVSMSEVWNSV